MKPHWKTLIAAGAFAAAAIALVFFTGCGSDPASPEPGTSAPAVTANLALNVMAVPPAASGPAAAVRLSSAKILLKHITFGDARSNDSADVKTGPYAVALDLAGGRTAVAAARVRPGLYDRLRFRLHKPEDAEPIPDPEFREGESGNLRYSVIVRGTVDGAPFEYRSRESAVQELQLPAPLAVGEEGTATVTLLVDPNAWFVAGGRTLDPSNASDRGLIDENIKRSFEAFKDNDGNGRPDDN